MTQIRNTEEIKPNWLYPLIKNKKIIHGECADFQNILPEMHRQKNEIRKKKTSFCPRHASNGVRKKVCQNIQTRFGLTKHTKIQASHKKSDLIKRWEIGHRSLSERAAPSEPRLRGGRSDWLRKTARQRHLSWTASFHPAEPCETTGIGMSVGAGVGAPEHEQTCLLLPPPMKCHLCFITGWFLLHDCPASYFTSLRCCCSSRWCRTGWLKSKKVLKSDPFPPKGSQTPQQAAPALDLPVHEVSVDGPEITL